MCWELKASRMCYVVRQVVCGIFKALWWFETLGITHSTAQCHIPDLNLQQYYCENIKTWNTSSALLGHYNVDSSVPLLAISKYAAP
jgi:hypothetical protein